MNEEWKDIEGYEGFYQVSNCGRVRSVDRIASHGQMRHGKVLALHLQNKGYLKARLSIDRKQRTVSVHRLVAEAFVPNPYGLKQVNHQDGIKTNNHVSNLEWASQEENVRHAINHGLIDIDANTRRIVKESMKQRKPVRQLTRDGRLLRTYDSMRDACRSMGKDNKSSIRACCEGKRKIGLGYRWEYV